MRRIARTAADGVGARKWLEIGTEKKALVMSELGCTNGCGRKWVRRIARTAADGKWVWRIALTAADGVGAREWLEMVGEKKPLGMSELGCATAVDGKWMGRIARTAADGVGAREWLGMGREKKPLGMSEIARAWLRGRLRTGNGFGELRGRLRTAWVQRSGWKWVGRSRW